jgi:hypothetical protein
VKSVCFGGADFDTLWRRRCAILTGSMRGGRGNALLIPSRALNVLVSPLLLLRVDWEGGRDDDSAGRTQYVLREH